MKAPMVAYWMGEPVNDMPREQLLGIVYSLAEELRVAREHHRSSLQMQDAFARARRRYA